VRKKAWVRQIFTTVLKKNVQVVLKIAALHRNRQCLIWSSYIHILLIKLLQNLTLLFLKNTTAW